MKSNRFWDVLLKVIVAAITAAATALTTTSCMGNVPIFKKERSSQVNPVGSSPFGCTLCTLRIKFMDLGGLSL
jgi:hypothetical protein